MTTVNSYTLQNVVFVFLSNVPKYENDMQAFLQTLRNPLNSKNYFYYMKDITDLRTFEDYIMSICRRFPKSNIIMFMSVYGNECDGSAMYLGNHLYPIDTLIDVIAKYKDKSVHVIIYSTIAQLKNKRPKVKFTRISEGSQIKHFRLPIEADNNPHNVLLKTIMRNNIFSESETFYNMTNIINSKLVNMKKDYHPTRTDYGTRGHVIIPQFTL